MATNSERLDPVAEGHALSEARQMWQRVRRHVPGAVSRQDLEQEARLSLWLASQDWDPLRGVPLWGYARLRVHGALVRHLRAVFGPGARVVGLDDVPEQPAPERDLDSSIDLQRAVRMADPGTSPAVVAHAEGFKPAGRTWTVAEVARVRGITTRAVRKALKSGRIIGKRRGGKWRIPEWAAHPPG